MSRTTRRLVLIGGMWLLSGCLMNSPESQAEDALGPEQAGVGPGPYHRAGQPCLVCHGEEHSPGGEIWELAGTVFERADSRGGLGGVSVVLTDADGDEFRARSNRAGNFFLRVDSGVSQPVLSGYDGELKIPRPLAFPLRVRIERGDEVQQMQGLIWRQGSCAHCHADGPSETSNGHIFLRGETP